MKKSIIALALASTSFTSVAAVADFQYVNVNDVMNQIDKAEKHGAIVYRGEKAISVHNPLTGQKVVFTKNGDKYKVLDGMMVHDLEVDSRGSIVKVNGNEAHISVSIDDKEMIDSERAERDANRNSSANNASDIRKIRDELDKNSKAAYDVVEKEYTAAAKHVAKQDARITTLEQDFSKMAQRQDALENRMDKVEKKMDSVMAGVHAVTNARPFVQDGQTAVGVGTGFAGSAQSVAIGAAHSFEDSAWSMSASMNVTTGSGVKTNVSGGVGAHYVF
ncbi:hypothetical protein A3K86_14205 [Photobacterium jeanii]|uniref:Trimeric autotransporter adhesin YadA-like C-terminal membrane anchor domain-containing protein n=1 Tax=Photobacterium jeanii TaxID=858640 RepID=A0A178K8P3_9GAMM|nr:YadA C-terminal domain-containing protein [Photobacterium jeanii]OAN13719.1 hypothetical protein A3K86_14205 [Photobacterium jeanii]PST88840.1 hypothetical protein C9I91_16070 [Photobacterium jeanii]